MRAADLVRAAMEAHDAVAADVGAGGGPPLYRVAMVRALEERLEPIAARAERELDEVRVERDELALAKLALADCQTLLDARSQQWARDRAELLDLTIAQARVIASLRAAEGRGE